MSTRSGLEYHNEGTGMMSPARFMLTYMWSAVCRAALRWQAPRLASATRDRSMSIVIDQKFHILALDHGNMGSTRGAMSVIE